MNEFHYRLENEQYVLFQDGGPIRAPLTEVGLVFDVESGTLHKHGDPALLQAWFDQTRKKLTDVDDPMLKAMTSQMANDLVFIQGAFDLDELNKCLSITGYVRRFYENLVAQSEDQGADRVRSRQTGG